MTSHSQKLLLGLVLGLVIGAVGGGLYVAKTQNVESSTESSEPNVITKTIEKLIPDNTPGIEDVACDNPIENCLYLVDHAYYPMGLATLEGYYTTYASTDWGGNPVTCEGFVATNGPAELFSGFSNLIDSGSGVVDRVNDDYRLGIAKEDLSDAEYRKLKSSNSNAQLTLKVFVKQPIDAGAPTCFAPFSIIDLE